MTISNFIEGLHILQNYCERDAYNISAEHDQVWAGPELDLLPYDKEEWSTEDAEYRISRIGIAFEAVDAKRLTELGWFVSKEGNWSAFV